jgi:hypothetical protein
MGIFGVGFAVGGVYCSTLVALGEQFIRQHFGAVL